MTSERKWRRTATTVAGVLVVVIATLAGLAAIVQFAIQLGWIHTSSTPPKPTPQPTATWTPGPTATPTLTPAPSPVPTGFAATTLHNGDGIPLNSAFDIKGVYVSGGTQQAWIVLGDAPGNYYLQTPAVSFDEDGTGTWSAHNIRAGAGITKVFVVWVTAAGNDQFNQMVAAGQFGAFSTLPAGSVTLLSIAVHVT